MWIKAFEKKWKLHILHAFEHEISMCTKKIPIFLLKKWSHSTLFENNSIHMEEKLVIYKIRPGGIQLVD